MSKKWQNCPELSFVTRTSGGQGESNIRRWIIQNDWLEAIIAQPLRAPDEIWADIRALERESEGLLEEIWGGGMNSVHN